MGINLGHDRSVAVVSEGELLVSIEQERLDRIKHSVGFMYQSPGEMRHIQVPGECIRYCLDMLDVPLAEMETITANMPGIDFAPDIMRGKFSRDIADKVQTIPSHHLAHAYSAYWPSGFEEALVLSVDASGLTAREDTGWKTESYSLHAGSGTDLKPIHSERVRAHLVQLSTLGFVYEYVSRKAGFETTVNAGLSFPEAGKLMGLAAYGGPQPSWESWLRPVENSLSLEISAYDIFLEIAALEKKYDTGEGKPYFRPWLVDLAYKAQMELENALCHIVEVAREQTGLNRLCIAGGIGLNSVANYKILTQCGLDDIFIFPAAADNGISAGCAYWAYATQEKGTARPKLKAATLGKPRSREEVEKAVDQYDDLIVVERNEHDDMVKKVADALSRGHIVARFEGGCESGPRALGHRSILADPAFLRMKDVINARVKFREAFRPFAPFVPLERANEVFVLETESPFMLLVAEIREEFHSVLPSITHADGTGRVQTCTKEANRFFHELCHAVEDIRQGPPVLLNTSFNVAGQPIVETPEQAIKTFLRTDIDYLALEDCWIYRKHTPVKSYEDHVADLVDESLPAGLPPDQPSVRGLMTELDAALFAGHESGNWAPEEVAMLSRQGARYKETSRLFPGNGFVGELKTQLGPDTVLLLDPKGQSRVADQIEHQPPLLLDHREVQLLLAFMTSKEESEDSLRAALGLTPMELRHEMTAISRKLERFGVSGDPNWLKSGLPGDSPLPPTGSDRTFAAFEDPDFASWHSLEAFQKCLTTHGYEEQAIIDLLGVGSLQQIEPTHLHYFASQKLPDNPLGDLIRLFLLRADLSSGSVRDLLGSSLYARLLGLGLITAEGDRVSSVVDIFCSGGMIFATDHRYMLMKGDRLEEDPVMYIGMDSHGLVQTAPREGCESLLDLCCGSGVQGLVGSRYATRVVAVDLNPRAVRFARFNAQLNGVQNYEVRLGSLYTVVEGERFDVILGNPPFVPSPETGLKFRDGGNNGEAILREIVEHADSHLSEGGRLCIVTDLVEIETYEARLRKWWGSEALEALVLTTADRDEILFSVPHCHAPFGQSIEQFNAELKRWVNNYREAGLKGVNFGYILVWKQQLAPGGTVTFRTIHNPSAPIHREVSTWLEQRRIWTSSEAAGFHMSLHPAVRLRSEHGSGNASPRCEVDVADNDFFTTYVIGETIHQELRRIDVDQPLLGSRLTPADSEWIEDLHRKGIVRLVRYPRQSGGNSNPSRPTTDHFQIEEMATKTTPTCLSSYLS
tara:strand:- start:25404 stop:29183 length:3780 start_codon:yes stop_codon:yes gene_type:complete